MYRVFSLLFSIALCWCGTPYAAADPPAIRFAEWPWAAVDAHTACIARFKLSAIDVKAISSKLAAQLPEENKKMLDVQVMISSGLLGQLIQAGVDEVYFLESTKQLATNNLVIVPCRDETIVGNMLQMFVDQIPKEFAYKIQRESGLVAICGDHVWTEITGRRKRLNAAGDLPEGDALNSEEQMAISRWQSILEPLKSSHVVAVSLPEPLREELSLLWPNDLQVGDSQISLSGFVKDTRSITLSAEATGQLQAMIAVNCADVSAAKRVEAQVQTVIQYLPKVLDDIKIPQPELQRSESQVRLTWDDLYTAIDLGTRQASENVEGEN